MGDPEAAEEAHERAFENADGPESEVEPSSAGNSPTAGRGRYEGGEGFDVFQCRTADADGNFGGDTCPNAGGVDQDIFGASMTP